MTSFKKRYRFSVVKILCLLPVVLMLSNCASYSTKLMQQGEKESWDVTKTEANVSVSAKTFFSSNQASYPFAINLMDESVLPVRVRVVNESADSIVVRKRAIKARVNSSSLGFLAVDNAADRFKFSPMKRYFAWSLGIAIPTVGFGLLPGIAIGITDGQDAKNANSARRQDFAAKAFHNVLLEKGKSVDGLLYFDSNAIDGASYLVLQVPVQSEQSGEIREFSIELPLSSTKVADVQ